jgi:amidohydrolase family protein
METAFRHYGASVGHIPIVMRLLGDSGAFLPRDRAVSRPVTAAELKQVEAGLLKGLKEGGLGFGFGIAYLPLTPRDQMLRLFEVAVMIASDGGLTEGQGHPRSAGSFARVLGRYVREQNVMPLAQAVRKMSYMPAQALEDWVPAMRRKGRIRNRADADITVFDAARVIDKATFEKPAQYSEWIVQVLVNGVFVVRNGALVTSALPGKPVRR